jgi:hypothetical protein
MYLRRRIRRVFYPDTFSFRFNFDPPTLPGLPAGAVDLVFLSTQLQTIRNVLLQSYEPLCGTNKNVVVNAGRRVNRGRG